MSSSPVPEAWHLCQVSVSANDCNRSSESPTAPSDFSPRQQHRAFGAGLSEWRLHRPLLQCAGGSRQIFTRQPLNKHINCEPAGLFQERKTIFRNTIFRFFSLLLSLFVKAVAFWHSGSGNFSGSRNGIFVTPCSSMYLACFLLFIFMAKLVTFSFPQALSWQPSTFLPPHFQSSSKSYRCLFSLFLPSLA